MKKKNEDKEENNGKELTAYEKLVEKVQQNKRKAAEELRAELKVNADKKKCKQSVEKEVEALASVNMNLSGGAVRFFEDDNIIEMDVTEEEQRKEFPSASEDGEITSDSNAESDEEAEEHRNNNASCCIATGAVWDQNKGVKVTQINKLPALDQMKPRYVEDDTQPFTSTENRGEENGKETNGISLEQTLNLMQSFMVKQGLLNKSISEREMQEFVKSAVSTSPASPVVSKLPLEKLDSQQKQRKGGKECEVPGRTLNFATKGVGNRESKSEITVYT